MRVGVDGRIRSRALVLALLAALPRVAAPLTVSVGFHNGGMADTAERLPRSVRAEPLVVEYTSEDVREMFRAMLALIALAVASIPEVRPR